MKNGTAVLLEGGRRGRIVRKLRKSISDNPDTFMVSVDGGGVVYKTLGAFSVVVEPVKLAPM